MKERYSSGTEVYPRRRPSVTALDSYSGLSMQKEGNAGIPRERYQTSGHNSSPSLAHRLALVVPVDISPAPSPVVCF